MRMLIKIDYNRHLLLADNADLGALINTFKGAYFVKEQNGKFIRLCGDQSRELEFKIIQDDDPSLIEPGKMDGQVALMLDGMQQKIDSLYKEKWKVEEEARKLKADLEAAKAVVPEKKQEEQQF